MPILHKHPPTVTYHHIRRIKLPYLVYHKIPHYKPNEITLIQLDIIFLCLLKHLRKVPLQSFVTNGKYVHVLVKILRWTVAMLFVHLLCKVVVILRVEVQLLKFRYVFHILRNVLIRVALKDSLRVTEHQFLEEPFAVDFLQISHHSFLFRKGHIHQVPPKVPDQLQIKLTLIPIQIYENYLGQVEATLRILHKLLSLHRHRLFPVKVLLFL